MSIPKSPEELQKELDIRMKKFLDKGGKVEKLEPGYPIDVGSFDKSRKPRYTKEEIKNWKPSSAPLPDYSTDQKGQVPCGDRPPKWEKQPRNPVAGK
jgi:hypothetical protein